MNVDSVWDLEVEGFTSVGGNCPYHGYWTTTTTTTMTETMTTTETETMNDEIDDDGIDNDDDNDDDDEDDIEDYLKLCGKRISTTFPARV